MMNKKRVAIIIDGGIGRVICAIPALERYVSSNPQFDVKIFIWGWDQLLMSNKILQPISFNINDKGIFDNYIRNSDIVLSPEPYRLPAYFRQEVSLREAFDIILNGDNSFLDYPRLHLSPAEIVNGKKIIEDCAKYQGEGKKTIVIQPFGSTARFESTGGDEVLDDTGRSMDLLLFSSIVNSLYKKYNIILFSDKAFHFSEDNITYKLVSDMRSFMAVISQCDYFIGCDSSGQHMARSFNTPGTVIFGSSFPENVSYPDWFQIIDKDKDERKYSPLRINDIDCKMADRINASCMKYSEREISNVLCLIESHIQKSVDKKSCNDCSCDCK